MKQFFKNFLRIYRRKMVVLSLVRIVSFVQALFWPYAFSRVVGILSDDPNHWQQALWWVIAIITNKIIEDFVRLRSKFGLEKIGSRLKVSLAEYFSEETEVSEKQRTGEAVQAVRQASDVIEGLVAFYRESALQLPVDLIVIPLILYHADPNYLLLLGLYIILYLLLDYIFARIYQAKMEGFFRAAEAFWGTTYRKTPDFWRHREDGHQFASVMDGHGDGLYQATVSAGNVNNWRWAVIQALSSACLGIAVLFVLLKIVAHETHVGDLVLVSAYFTKTQGTLNIATNALTHFIHARIALRRLARAVRLR